MSNIAHIIAKFFINSSPELNCSFLDRNNILWRFDKEGTWVGKPAVKDPNHKGHRYIWEEEIK